MKARFSTDSLRVIAVALKTANEKSHECFNTQDLLEALLKENNRVVLSLLASQNLTVETTVAMVNKVASEFIEPSSYVSMGNPINKATSNLWNRLDENSTLEQQRYISDQVGRILEVDMMSPCRRVIEIAYSEARGMGTDVIEIEHLFIGLLRVKEGVVGRAFNESDFSIEYARRDILRISRNK